MNICMVGTGYVGLVSGTGFAEIGNRVICADIDATKIARLQKGEIPIFEPGLDEMVERNVKGGRLSFSNDVGASIAASQMVFIAVGTPQGENGAADLRAVEAVAKMIGEHAINETVVVCKSTVPVGTNAKVRRILANAKAKMHVVSNPEFLKEGDAINDFLRPDRIVIGCDQDDTFARELMEKLYHPVCLDHDRIVWMAPQSAELTKYVANTMLAMRISFMNEIAQLCDKVGADVHDVRLGVGSDTRIGTKFLYSGPGYGGSCFPKDVTALSHTAREAGMELTLAETTDIVNQRAKLVLAQKLRAHFDGSLKGKRIAVWGIAFKPRTDDIREAPALTLIDALLAEGAEVSAHDPEARAVAKEKYGTRIELPETAYDAAKGADALVLVTEWRQYQSPDFEKLKTLMRRPLLIDGRNIWSGYGLRSMGFTYDGIGVRGS
ncbi:MAG: UDP-glucose/GDP-mannose dehydrogenase family protein [Sandaracinaceae bacterium]|nr:UDP-glucose/GDP-mannose dehydrogenase family protein [Sandaracinaceae bacterium]